MNILVESLTALRVNRILLPKADDNSPCSRTAEIQKAIQNSKQGCVNGFVHTGNLLLQMIGREHKVKHEFKVASESLLSLILKCCDKLLARINCKSDMVTMPAWHSNSMEYTNYLVDWHLI